ncbi:MAG: hypothetical protein G5Z42_07530 [Caldisphaeraceae archaeon]|nr:hypothetical protein [Caldisphaeraceae archaeon]
MVILEIMRYLPNPLAGEQQHEFLKKLAKEGSVVNIARKLGISRASLQVCEDESNDTRLSR